MEQNNQYGCPASSMPPPIYPARSSPQAIALLLQQGMHQHQQAQLLQASACYYEILQSDPENGDALHLLGLVELQRGNHVSGIELIGKACVAMPNNAIPHFNLGVGLDRLGHYQQALHNYEHVLKLEPDHLDALNNRALTLVRLNRHEEALAAYEQVIELRPGFAEAIANRGNVLRTLKRYEEALKSYDLALSINPSATQVHSNRGAVLQNLGRHEDALRSYDMALDLHPNSIEALLNRGSALRHLYRFEEALENYDKLQSLSPNSIELHMNRGNVLRELNRHREALTSFRRMQELDPHQPHGHLGEFNCLASLGNLEQAWPKYEWRPTGKRQSLPPLWLGKESLRGKTILLHGEQGFGDMIHFCRYITLVAAKGAKVLLEVPQPLAALMRGLAGISEVLVRGASLPPFDFHCPLMSLPLAFNTVLGTIPASVPYMYCEANDNRAWQKKLDTQIRQHTGLRIGIAWSGNPAHDNDINRSMGLGDFISIVDKHSQFVCLQKEIRATDKLLLQQHPEILCFAADLHDFSDTAGLIAQMDLVISVDTAIAHLAGAMGKPTWILLPFNAEWRWLLEREDSPWYPSVRLFRQSVPLDWKPVLASIAHELSALE